MTKVRFLGISLLAALAMFAVACTSEEEPTSTPILEPTATATQVPTVVSTPLRHDLSDRLQVLDKQRLHRNCCRRLSAWATTNRLVGFSEGCGRIRLL